jgi:hypothetical protein
MCYRGISVSEPPASAAPHEGPSYEEGKATGALALEAVRAHLTIVLASAEFESSRRSRELLAYLVEKTLLGYGDRIKERLIGEDVFGRPGYEPSEQNSVRVAANELRKRLANFYEAHPAVEIQIDLPRGSYQPVFLTPAKAIPVPSEPPPAPVVPESRRKSSAWTWVAAASLIAAAAGSWLWTSRPAPEDAFWAPVLAAKRPALIWCAGWGAVLTEPARDQILSHEKDLHLQPDDIFPVDQLMAFGHTHGIATTMSWLGGHGRPAELRLGNWSMPADAGNRPLIAFGFNNPWTVEMNRGLRFKVVHEGAMLAVVDQQNPGRRWTIEWKRRGYDQTLDYGIITRIIDPVTGQVRISIGGLCHYSSQAGAEFLTTAEYWTEVDRTAPRGWKRMNLQVVLEVHVVEKVPQSPKPVAWHFW